MGYELDDDQRAFIEASPAAERASESVLPWTRQAVALAAGVSPRERAWIDAIARRYEWPAPADRAALDAAYAEGMRAAYARFAFEHPVHHRIMFASEIEVPERVAWE